MTKNRTPTPVYLDPGMHPGLEVKGLNELTLTREHHKVLIAIGSPVLGANHDTAALTLSHCELCVL